MGKAKPLLFLLVAILLALGTSFLIYRLLQQKTAPVETAPKTRPVAVAAVDLPAGTRLGEAVIQSSVKMVPYLIETLPPGHFTATAAFQDRALVASLKATELILESKLTASAVATGGLSALISGGKRAVTMSVDKVTGVAGFVLPGNRVDVMATVDGEEDGRTSKTVLNDVLVLAVGHQIDAKANNDPKARADQQYGADVVTLELTPEEAEKLALATAEGRVLLTLRGAEDKAPIATEGETVVTLLESLRPEQGRVRTDDRPGEEDLPRRKPVVPSVSVEILDGDDVIKRSF